MRHISLFVVIILAALLVTACNSTDRTTSDAPVTNVSPTSPKATAPSDGIRRITVAELRTLVDKGEAFIVDVRNEPAYKQGHIKGARLIPTNEVLKRADELPRDKVIVTYCS